MRYRFVLLALALAGPADAQQLYKCGNTFSQQPCGADATVIPSAGVAQPTGPVDAATQRAIEADCRSWVTRVPPWKDRDSVKVGTIFRSDAVSRDGRLVRAYRVMVNGKNSYGGYEGERPFVCYADEKTAKVVDLYVPGDVR